MAEHERKPPQSAEELLERYARGERDFAGATLADAQLSGARLHRTNLWRALMPRAQLNGAILLEASMGEAHLSMANLSDTTLQRVDLSGANLRDAVLSGADLRSASLRHADLRCADLRRSILVDADLADANLEDANLRGADLSRASLVGANLSEARLNGANLRSADLCAAILHGTTFDDANVELVALDATVLADLDFSPLCDSWPPVRHQGPSRIDYGAILRSLRSPKLKDFLQRAGVPDVLVEYIVDCGMALGANVFQMMRSTFISYGHPDERFAIKLYEALHRNGVRSFLFAEHATPGEKLHRTMRKGIAEHDRVVLVCSRNSLDREGVLFEIEEALTREAMMKGETLLIPIRLDDYVFNGWAPKNPDVAQAVRDRVVADFEGADKDEDKFNAGLRKLIAALRK